MQLENRSGSDLHLRVRYAELDMLLALLLEVPNVLDEGECSLRTGYSRAEFAALHADLARIHAMARKGASEPGIPQDVGLPTVESPSPPAQPGTCFLCGRPADTSYAYTITARHPDPGVHQRVALCHQACLTFEVGPGAARS